MTSFNSPAANISIADRAEQILNALIEQTAQAEYDDDAIEKLVNEYESLMN